MVSHYCLYNRHVRIFINAKKFIMEFNHFTFLDNKWTAKEMEINLFCITVSMKIFHICGISVMYLKNCGVYCSSLSELNPFIFAK